MDWRAYLRSIEEPNHPEMQGLLDKALDRVRKQLVDDGAEPIDDAEIEYRDETLDRRSLRKFAYTYYYDWERDGSPSFVFLVQNPGPLVRSRHLDDEANELLAAVDAENPHLTHVRVNRGYLKDWLWRLNRRFAGGFFPLLAERDLIHFGTLEDYLDGAFYSDFVLTDLVKYRVTTDVISGGNTGNAAVAFEEYLAQELEALDPDLIFSFGSRCWQALRNNLGLSPVSEAGPDTDAVTDAHGFLYAGDDRYVIPLTHFSGRNAFLRDSYSAFLEDGIETYLAERR